MKQTRTLALLMLLGVTVSLPQRVCAGPSNQTIGLAATAAATLGGSAVSQYLKSKWENQQSKMIDPIEQVKMQQKIDTARRVRNILAILGGGVGIGAGFSYQNDRFNAKLAQDTSLDSFANKMMDLQSKVQRPREAEQIDLEEFTLNEQMEKAQSEHNLQKAQEITQKLQALEKRREAFNAEVEKQKFQLSSFFDDSTRTKYNLYKDKKTRMQTKEKSPLAAYWNGLLDVLAKIELTDFSRTEKEDIVREFKTDFDQNTKHGRFLKHKINSQAIISAIKETRNTTLPGFDTACRAIFPDEYKHGMIMRYNRLLTQEPDADQNDIDAFVAFLETATSPDEIYRHQRLISRIIGTVKHQKQDLDSSRLEQEYQRIFQEAWNYHQPQIRTPYHRMMGAPMTAPASVYDYQQQIHPQVGPAGGYDGAYAEPATPAYSGEQYDPHEFSDPEFIQQ